MKHILLLTALLSSAAFASDFDETMVLAKQGDANAQYELATMLYQGSDSIKKNPAEAFKWYAKSARQGNGQSAWKLGDIYRHGLYWPLSKVGVIAATDTALSSTRKVQDIARTAQRVTSGGASSTFGLLFGGASAISATKTLLEKDLYCSTSDPDYYVKAYMWYKISVLNEPKKTSETKVRRLSLIMSKEQIAEAQQLASLCLDSDYKDCGLEDNGSANKLDLFRSNLFDEAIKWKVSECTRGGKLERKYLSAASGRVSQAFTPNGQLAEETSSTANVSARQWFYPSGKLKSDSLYRQIPEGIRSQLKRNPNPPFEILSSSGYYESGKLRGKTTYSPVKAPKNGRRKNELKQYPVLTESYDENGQLTKKRFYKERSKRYLKEEFYNEDGTIRRTKKYK